MNLSDLIESIKTDFKFSADDILSRLTSAVTDCCDDEYIREIFIELYINSYGRNMTEEIAENFLTAIRSDNGRRWNMAQCYIIGNSVGVDWTKISKIDWYTALNLEYEKHMKTAEIIGRVDDPEFFALIAKDEWADGNSKIFDLVFS